MSGTNAGLLYAIVLLTVLVISACSATSPQVVFYTLGVDAPVTQSAAAGTACSNTGIGVGPVNWPRYLDQPRIVTRSGPNKLYFDEFHRWGGSLQDDFEQVLKRNLSTLLQTSKVSGSRISRRFTPDYRVELDIRQFEGQLGSEVVLDASWLVIDQQTGKTMRLRDSMITRQVSGQGYEALVRASSQAVTELSGEIATELLRVCSAVK